MSFSSVANIITARVAAQFPGLEPSVVMQWQNDGNLPEIADVEYIKTYVDEIRSDQVEKGSLGGYRLIGLIRIDVYTELNTGTKRYREICDSIGSIFIGQVDTGVVFSPPPRPKMFGQEGNHQYGQVLTGFWSDEQA